VTKLNSFDDEGYVDKEIISKFENAEGFSLPAEYKSLISLHNALTPVECIFDYRYRGEVRTGDINFLGYGDVSEERSISFLQQKEFGHKGLVVFGVTADGDYVCFDYRKNVKLPEVVLMLHDVFDSNEKMEIVPVSNSFNLFIDSLRPDENSLN